MEILLSNKNEQTRKHQTGMPQRHAEWKKPVSGVYTPYIFSKRQTVVMRMQWLQNLGMDWACHTRRVKGALSCGVIKLLYFFIKVWSNVSMHAALKFIGFFMLPPRNLVFCMIILKILTKNYNNPTITNRNRGKPGQLSALGLGISSPRNVF